jgi:hypothetical protein
VTPPTDHTATAVVLGVIQEQMAELNRKMDGLVTRDAERDGRLRAVELDVATIKADRNRRPSQWPAIAGAVTSIAAIIFTFFALIYR